ncbi:hypothetical protein [Amycolatopsis cihanbeyliensis]|uniref:Uncharacterized protein n=1 Tax=Amycolatopsis cihanbeyliensis TaxID=1128664 RepID=A0A542DJJ3_AMYCI|nr:hypothetical protein [Amycolatopsis cihanbeyliensis]TQJ03262.1 hypothetical protein FB471_3017 [Amycolatopsis cihanbeyliensis]
MNTVDERDPRALARQQAEGLRRLAAMLESHPELAEDCRYMLGTLYQPLTRYTEDPRGALASFHAAAVDSGADPTIHNGAERCTARVAFGPVVVEMSADADVMTGQVCRPKYAPLTVTGAPEGGGR